MKALTRRRIVVWLVALVIAVVAGASVALAQTRLGGKIQAGDEIVVASGETIDGDLYASGGRVRVDGTVDGDLVVAAGQLTVDGEVTGDVIASAGTVDIGGEVLGDARIAAGQVSVSGTIEEDLFVASGQARIAASGEVGEDLVFGNGRMTMDGSVGGDVLGATGNYDRQGTVAGEENVTIGQDEEEAPTAGDRILDAVQALIGILVVAALFMWLAPKLAVEPADTLRQRPLAALGVGFLALIGFGLLIALIFLVAVLVVIVLALVGLSSLLGAVVFASLVAVVLLAFLFFLVAAFGAPAWTGLSIASGMTDSDSSGRRWAALIIGVVLVVAVSSIPIVGGWIGFVVLLFGLGTLVLTYRPRRAAVQPAVE
ncbi:MAG TPA: polymer-forming cytoskeletal protein [Acidimicrobiia bacterium]|jgi:cytoskeletal protein CcmA (bactofilin family)|nr:polymer-forming cytoskeletal protein [Acidimicrobiia bacterium]